MRHAARRAPDKAGNAPRPREAIPLTATRKTTVLLLFILFAGLTFAVPPASASPTSAQKARLRSAQAKLEKVYAQADAAVEKFNQATSHLATVRMQIEQNQQLLALAEHNLELAETQLQDRAASIYKARDTSFLDAMFAAGSFDDLVLQLDLMQRLSDSDVDVVTSLNAYRQDVKDRRLTLQSDEKTADRLVGVARTQKGEILALQARLEDLTAGIKAEIRQLQAQAAARAQAAAEADQAAVVVDPGGSGQGGVVAIAQQQLGKPYLWAAAGPNAFDCSGLTMYCYARIGISLAHAATLQQQASTPVPLDALQPGDLVFFGGPGWSGHVGIYVGGGSMIDAPHSGAVVRYDSIGGAWIGGRF